MVCFKQEPGNQLKIGALPGHQDMKKVWHNVHASQPSSSSRRVGAGSGAPGASPSWKGNRMPSSPKGFSRDNAPYMPERGAVEVGGGGGARCSRRDQPRLPMPSRNEADAIFRVGVGVSVRVQRWRRSMTAAIVDSSFGIRIWGWRMEGGGASRGRSEVVVVEKVVVRVCGDEARDAGVVYDMCLGLYRVLYPDCSPASSTIISLLPPRDAEDGVSVKLQGPHRGRRGYSRDEPRLPQRECGPLTFLRHLEDETSI